MPITFTLFYMRQNKVRKLRNFNDKDRKVLMRYPKKVESLKQYEQFKFKSIV